jgi:FecR protein
VSDKRKPGIYLAWRTVTYRTVGLIVLALIVIFVTAVHFAFPQASQSGFKEISRLSTSLLERIAGEATDEKPSVAINRQAHFTNIDGAVKVKKANSNSWTPADYSLPLEKGDVVQTSSEGMAKIVFNDGTNYTVKQDSLIVIEENSANEKQQTSVAVTVNTGTVDLATGTYVQGSSSKVIVGGATASLAPDSAARVRNDPKGDQHEILVTKGSGEVARNGESLHLADYEKVRFQSDSSKMAKIREVGPPTPISPANMAPIFTSGGTKDIDFSWTAMVNAAGYRLRVSRNPFFSSTIIDKRVPTAEVEVSGLTEGAYYWAVQSYDQSGKESMESEKNRFTIIEKENDNEAMNLELDPFVQHGHVIEVTGKTENGARVMVNGREVPMIASDGTFHYFTPPLPLGESVITITAQNSRGGVNTQQKKVIIQ